MVSKVIKTSKVKIEKKSLFNKQKYRIPIMINNKKKTAIDANICDRND